MAINLGAAYVDIVPSTSGLARNLKRDIETPLAQSGVSSGRGFASSFTSGLSSLAGAVGRTVGAAVTATATAAGIGLGVALTGGWKRMTTIDDATRALTISLGDAGKATSLLDDVLSVVEGTPFNLDHFAAAAQQMAGMGIEADKIPVYLTAIGEAAATQGSRANEYAERLSTVFSQVAAQGSIGMMEVRRLSDVGVNALAILGNHFGLTTEEMKKMISTGAVPAGEALDVLAAGILDGSDGVAGATVALEGTMASLRESLSGAAGGFKASLDRFGVAILEPFKDDITEFITVLTEMTDGIAGEVKKWAEEFRKTEGFQNFMEWLRGLPEKLKGVAGMFEGMSTVIGPLAGAFAALATSGLSALPFLGALFPTISPLVGAFAGLVAVSPELQQVFKDLWKALEPVFVELGDAFAEMAKKFTPRFVDLLVRLADVFLDVLEALLPALPVLAQVLDILLEFVVIPGLEWFVTGLEAIASGFEAMGDWGPAAATGLTLAAVGMWALNAAMAANPIMWVVVGLITLVGALITAYQEVEWFRDAVDSVVGAMVWFGETINNFVHGVWADFGASIEGVVNFFTPVYEALERFGTAFNETFDSVVNGMIAFGTAINEGFDEIVNWFIALPGRIAGGIGDVSTTLWLKGTELLEGLRTGIVNGAVAVFNWFVALPGNILAWIGNVAGTLTRKGIDFLQGLWNGIVTKWNEFRAWFNPKQWIKDFFVGARDWLYNAGLDIMAGLARGLNIGAKRVKNDVTRGMNAITQAVRDSAEVRSPSRVYMRIGGWLMEGLEDGIEQGLVSVLKTVGTVADEMDKTFTKALSPVDMSATAHISTSASGVAMDARNVNPATGARGGPFIENANFYGDDPTPELEFYARTTGSGI